MASSSSCGRPRSPEPIVMGPAPPDRRARAPAGHHDPDLPSPTARAHPAVGEHDPESGPFPERTLPGRGVDQYGSSSFLARSSMFSGGQFWMSLLQWSPIVDRTSLLSFRALRPQFELGTR